jgi:hypothetical protein
VGSAVKLKRSSNNRRRWPYFRRLPPLLDPIDLDPSPKLFFSTQLRRPYIKPPKCST